MPVSVVVVRVVGMKCRLDEPAREGPHGWIGARLTQRRSGGGWCAVLVQGFIQALAGRDADAHGLNLGRAIGTNTWNKANTYIQGIAAG
jgi:hypothetical protein